MVQMWNGKMNVKERGIQHICLKQSKQYLSKVWTHFLIELNEGPNFLLDNFWVPHHEVKVPQYKSNYRYRPNTPVQQIGISIFKVEQGSEPCQGLIDIIGKCIQK